MRHVAKSLAETEGLARVFLEETKPLPRQAVVVGLIGDLGSGKTAFTQAVARELGVTERITSPTFVIQKNYPLGESGHGFRRLVHIDAYRLGKPEELLQLGWAELLADSGNLVLVEWADRVLPILPASTPKLLFHFVDENTREIRW
jgi:tRNA threonylcarbamoyladenosine biosynthesis protein TsaE